MVIEVATDNKPLFGDLELFRGRFVEENREVSLQKSDIIVNGDEAYLSVFENNDRFLTRVCSVGGLVSFEK